MRKLKKIRVGNLTMLSQQEMMNLSGGEKNFTCRTTEPCKLYIEKIGITVEGTCEYSAVGTTVSCYCRNGMYYTSPGQTTSCWRA